MEKHKQDETFLARWISGELTPEELKEFKKTDDYVVLNKINDASQTFEAPKFDHEALFSKLKQHKLHKKRQEKKGISLIPSWSYAVAASIIIALGIFYYFNIESQFQTGFGEQLAVLLPDNSEVKLNANSELSYQPINWKNNRKLNLNGEAFFDVEKGQKFTVFTDEGSVEVMGTEFNVISRSHYFEVQCQEGKVKVTSNFTHGEIILLPGNAVRFVNNKLEKWDYDIKEPNWLLGESTFHNTPLSQVIIALENQFKITFDPSNIDLSERFTGGFTHKDLNLALKTVMIPMDISYSAENNKVILKNLNN